MIRNMGTPPEVHALMVAVAEQHGISIGILLSTNREKEVVAARRSAARLLRESNYSLPEIGRFLRKNHTSILHLLSSPTPVYQRSLKAQYSISRGVELDLRARLSQLDADRKVLSSRIAALNILENDLLAVLETLKGKAKVA